MDFQVVTLTKEQVLEVIQQLDQSNAPLLGRLYTYFTDPKDCEIFLFYSSEMELEFHEIKEKVAVAIVNHEEKRSVLQLRFLLQESPEKLQAIFKHLIAKLKVNGPTFWLPAQPQMHIDLLQNMGYKVNYNEPYNVYVKKDGHAQVVHPQRDIQVKVGDQTVKMKCKIDHLTMLDIPLIRTQMTVDYPDHYLTYLLTTEPYKNLHYCVRLTEIENSKDIDVKVGEVLSWCLTHRDYSTGLIGTRPEFRGLGLANEATRQTLSAQQTLQKSLSLPLLSFGFVAPTNVASQKLMERNGFEKTVLVSWVELESPK